MTGKTSIFHRASVFLKNIKSSSKAVETREAGTEAIVETDNIHINTEIYSETDLPGAFECYDGNCMILYASRSKNVTTECDGCNENAAPAEPAPPVSEDEKKEEEPPVEAPVSEIQETQKDSWDEGSRLLTEAKKDHVEQKRPMCHPDCPNLFISRYFQVDKADKVRVSTAKTVAITRADKESVCSSTAEVAAAKSCQRPASVPSINLSPIQEEEDASTRASEPSIPARVSCETMRSVEYAASTTSCVTRQEDDWSEREADEQNGFSTDEEYTTEMDVEAEDAKEPTADAHEGTDGGDAVVLEDVDESVVEEAADRTISEEAADQAISEQVAGQETDEEATDQQITDEAADQSVMDEAVDQSDVEEAVDQSDIEVPANQPAIEEPENQPVVEEPANQPVVDEPVDRPTVDGATFKAEQKDTSEKGIETETIFEREPRKRRRSRRAITGTWITSLSPSRLEETEIRSCVRSSRSPSNQPKYRESCETQCSSYIACCVTSANCFCDDDSRAEQLCPTVYCSSKSSSTFGWPRVPVSCDQLYRINNAKNQSMTACNRYQGSWCPSGQAYRDTCTPRCTPRSSMNYCSPSYHYSYNSWY
nr:altered inheritance of mitochondria protein 21-like [Megalopta genalis]